MRVSHGAAATTLVAAALVGIVDRGVAPRRSGPYRDAVPGPGAHLHGFCPDLVFTFSMPEISVSLKRRTPWQDAGPRISDMRALVVRQVRVPDRRVQTAVHAISRSARRDRNEAALVRP